MAWRPAVVHPELKEGDALVTARRHPPVKALDRAELTTAAYPSWNGAGRAAEKYGEKAGGEPASSCGSSAARRRRRRSCPTNAAELSEGTPGT
ncbi:hypothetical protein GCM10023238_31580 [Streptomyces heliomycini]